MISDKDWLIAKMSLSRTVGECFLQPAMMKEYELTKERHDTLWGEYMEKVRELEEWMFHDNTKKEE